VNFAGVKQDVSASTKTTLRRKNHMKSTIAILVFAAALLAIGSTASARTAIGNAVAAEAGNVVAQ
jgi:hypothetical protein